MASIATFDKDSAASLNYTIDWSAWLPSGEAVTSADWDVPSGLTEVSSSTTSTTTTVRLSGGTVGTLYTCRCVVTTTPSSYVDARSIDIRVITR